jgi:hypothetical protein
MEAVPNREVEVDAACLQRENDQGGRSTYSVGPRKGERVEGGGGLGVVAIVVIGIGASLLVVALVGHTHRITKASTTGSVSTQINNNQ